MKEGCREGRDDPVTTNKPISRDEFKEPSHGTLSYFSSGIKSPLNQRKLENSSLLR